MAHKKPTEPKKPRLPASQTDEEVFVRGLVERGEAARSDGGELPPGVTHEIVDEKTGRLPKVKRRRFSAR